MGVAFLLEPDCRHVLLVVESEGSEIFFILSTGCLVWCLMVVMQKAILKQESICPTCRRQGKIVQV
ncbi:unnamed protein product [Sphagnum troendelagicum]